MFVFDQRPNLRPLIPYGSTGEVAGGGFAICEVETYGSAQRVKDANGVTNWS